MDLYLPDGSGIDLLGSISAPAIMISGHGTIADAVHLDVTDGAVKMS